MTGGTHHRAIEDVLTAVGIADPLVESEDGDKILEVHDLRQQGVWEEVVDRYA